MHLCENFLNDKRNIARSNQPNNYFLGDYVDNIAEANEKVVRRVNYLQTDIVHFLPWYQKIRRFLSFNDYKIYLLIIITCSLMSFAALLISNLTDIILYYKNFYVIHHLFFLLPFTIFCGVMATHLCTYSPSAEGSGIPEFKTVLSGTSYYDFLGSTTFAIKYFSILFVRLAGLGIGFEAAFSHLSAIISHRLIQTSFFKELKLTNHNWRVALGASASLGMVIVFGAPIGGIIFAIEIYTSNFKVSNLLKFFVASTVSYFYYIVLKDFFKLKAIKSQKLSYSPSELPHFAIVGIFEGIFASLFLTLWSRFLTYKRAHKALIFTNRYKYLGLFTFINTMLIFPHSQFFCSFKDVIGDLIGLDRLTDSHDGRWWFGNYRVIGELIYSLIVRLIQMIGFCTSPIPFGTFTPGLIIGGMIGRLYGEFARHVFGSTISPRLFALAGLGSFLCGVTRTFSPMIFVLEMTSQMDMLLPMLIVQVVAFGFCSSFNMGMFEITITIRKLPFLPSIISPQQALLPVNVIAERVVDKLNVQSSFYDVLKLLDNRKFIDVKEQLPIVNKEDMVVGSVQTISLYKMIDSILHLLESGCRPGLEIDYPRIYDQIRTSMQTKNLANEHVVYGIVADFIREYHSHIDQTDTRFELTTQQQKTEKVHAPLLRRTLIMPKVSKYNIKSGKSITAFSSSFRMRTSEQVINQRDQVKEMLDRIVIDWAEGDIDAKWIPI